MSERFTEEDLKKMGLKVQPDGSYKKPVFDAKKHHPDPVGPKGEVGPKGDRIEFTGTGNVVDSAPITFSGTVFIDPVPVARILKYINGRAQIGVSSKYTAYMKVVASELSKLDIPKEKWCKLDVTFFYKFPNATPKYKRYEGKPRIIRPDWDNLMKGFQDALTKSETIHDDDQIYDGRGVKRYTMMEPRIEFTLST